MYSHSLHLFLIFSSPVFLFEHLEGDVLLLNIWGGKSPHVPPPVSTFDSNKAVAVAC